MTSSTQLRNDHALWTSRQFDQRVEFDARDLLRQPDFGPDRRATATDAANDGGDHLDEGYAQHFYGERVEAISPRREPDEGLGDIAAMPRHINNAGNPTSGLTASMWMASRPARRRQASPQN